MSSATLNEPSPATTRTVWQIDPVHTHVSFAVKHLMISTVKGRFSDVTGSIRLAGDDFTTADVEVTIGTASVDTREERRDAHLRSADFFHADAFPTMTFKSRGVSATSPGHFKLTGDLSIRGVTRAVVLDVVDEGRVRDPWGGDRAGFNLKTSINRRDFGLVWNQVLEAGGVAVGDTVKIEIEAELVRT